MNEIALFFGCAAATLVHSLLEFAEMRIFKNQLQRNWNGFLTEPPKKFKFYVPIRKKSYLKDAPDFLELCALGLSSGLHLEKAFEMAVRFLPERDLKNELLKTAQVLAAGRDRSEAFKELSERLRHPSLSGVFILMVQALKRGTPLQSILLDQAEYLRSDHFSRIEKRAQTIGTRLLFPIMVFIFPTIFIVLFGALFLQYLQNGQLF